MKNLILILMLSLICNITNSQDNPLLKPYNTKYNIPPFDKIKSEHFMPAFKEGMKQQSEAVKKISENMEPATFENTIETLEFSDYLLSEVSGVFYNLLSANTNKEIQGIAKEVSPLLSGHKDDIMMNEKLFARVKTVYDSKDNLSLTTEQKMLLEEYYKQFIRGGAGLDKDKQARFREINGKLSLLSLKFGENLLAETNGYKLIIENKDDLAGLPQGLKDAAAETAKKAGLEGQWVFTLSNSSVMPFLQYSAKRDLREKILKAYSNRGNNENENDNKKIIVEIINLRIEKANLLGYKSHADFVLTESMAKNPANVYKLLDKLWTPALKRASREAYDLQGMIDKEKGDFKLQTWDWRYYTEKLRKEKYDIDEEE
ncbi:MAG: M3 family metallopeptidase, partial [Ignavibacteriae bacterium]|nr:M3 family metallopeptidase [Ignavibacteriota bacterium]